MSRIEHVYYLARCVLPISVILFTIIVRFARANVASAKDRHVLFAVAASQVAIPVAISLLGGLFFCPGPQICHNQGWLTVLVYVLFLLQMPIWLYIIWEVKRYRFLIVVLILSQFVASFAVYIAASISIYGDGP